MTTYQLLTAPEIYPLIMKMVRNKITPDTTTLRHISIYEALKKTDKSKTKEERIKEVSKIFKINPRTVYKALKKMTQVLK